jgi:hypothetical protein
MATVTTYDPKCLDLAKAFLAAHADLNTERKQHLLALEIQQVIKDEIEFMREMPEMYL